MITGIYLTDAVDNVNDDDEDVDGHFHDEDGRV
jgi:hypothetical protein